MEINVLEHSKTKLIIEVKGEDATLCNILRKELWNDSSVKAAAYSVKHPAVGVPQMIIETTGKDPKDALVDAVSRLRKDLAGFEKAVAKAV
ncbi:DNA-directed RNA polymerase subunit L [Thermoproteota archaeon]